MIISKVILIMDLHQYERKQLHISQPVFRELLSHCHIQLRTTHWTLKASSWLSESSPSCYAVLVDSTVAGCRCHAHNFIHSKLQILTRYISWNRPILQRTRRVADFTLNISSGRPIHIHLPPCWGNNIHNIQATSLSEYLVSVPTCDSCLSTMNPYIPVLSFVQHFVCFYKSPPPATPIFLQYDILQVSVGSLSFFSDSAS